MFFKTILSVFIYSITLLAGNIGNVFAQQPPANKGAKTIVYFNMPGRNDTAFQARTDKHHPVTHPAIHAGNARNTSIKGLINLTINTIASTCNDYNGGIIVTASGGTAPYSFLCTFSIYSILQNTGNFQNLAQGTYQITVVDSKEDTAYATTDVGNNFPGLSLDVDSRNSPTTCSSFDGAIILAASNGTPPYEYSLDDVNYQSGNGFINLAPGYYNGFVRDANGCKYMRPGAIILDSNTPCFGASLEFSSSSCNNDATIEFVQFLLGTPPYQFSLDGINYQDSGKFTHIGVGLHPVYIKDAAGSVNIYNVPIYPYCPVIVNDSIVDATCNQNNGSLILQRMGGTPPFTYTLDGVNYQTSNTFTGLAPGNYTFTIKDGNGDAYSDGATINTSCLQVSLATTSSACNKSNGSVTISASNGTPPYQYSIDGINFQTGNTFNGLAAAPYTVYVQDATNAKKDTSIIITGTSAPTIDVTFTRPTCGNTNGAITISATGVSPLQYSIDGSNYNNAPVFNNLDSGKYIAYVKDGGGCINTDTVRLTEQSLPAVFIGNDTSLCYGQTLMLSAPQQGGYSYKWQNGSTAYNYQVTSAGIYYVKVTNLTGCSVSDTVLVSYSGTLSFSIGNDTTICTGQFLTLQASPDQPGNYLWNTGASSHDILVNTPGLYWLEINNGGCLKRDSISISGNPSPIVNLGNDTILCSGTPIILDALNTGSTYLWQNNSTAHNFTVTAPGIYYVKVTALNNCTSSDTIQIKYNKTPAFTLGSDSVLCDDQTLLLQPFPSVQGNYLWNTGVTTSSLLAAAPGIYWLQVNDSGCIKTDSITLNYKNNPSIFLGNDTTICAGNTILLNAAYNNAAYLWQDGSIQPHFLVSNAGIYFVTVNLNGCIEKDTIRVAYLDKPVFTLGPDTVICQEQNIALHPRLNVAASYLWQDGSTQPQFVVTDVGQYSLQATNICGSFSDDIVISQGLCTLMLPNTFTPNRDGLNDVFSVKYPFPVKSFLLSVYNRFGEKVFETTDMTKAWDGTYKGLDQPVGVYVWVVRLQNTHNKEQASKGIITLLR